MADPSLAGTELPPEVNPDVCPLLVSGTHSRESRRATTRPRIGDRPWDVLVMIRGEHGELVQAALTPAQARQAAIDLNAMAEICTHGVRL